MQGSKNGFMCPIPWVSIGIDTDRSFRICCHSSERDPLQDSDGSTLKLTSDTTLEGLQENEKVQQVKNALLRGEVPNICRTCERLEEVTSRSPRLYYLWRFNKEDKLKFLQFSLDNICNLKCRMCSPRYSHLLEKDWKEMGVPIPAEVGREDRQVVYDLLNDDNWFESFFSEIEELKITGGEPFISPIFEVLVQQILNFGFEKQIHIYVCTNAMTYKEELLEKLKKFRSLYINVSLDGIEELAEYVRYPTCWETVDKNIKKYVNDFASLENCRVDFYVVMQAYTLVGLSHVIEYLAQYEDQVVFVPAYEVLQDPPALRVQSLRKEYIDIAYERLCNLYEKIKLRNEEKEGALEESLDRMKNLISVVEGYSKNYTPASPIEFTALTGSYDRLRKQSFSDILKKYGYI